jgi:hypothetical protein
VHDQIVLRMHSWDICGSLMWPSTIAPWDISLPWSWISCVPNRNAPLSVSSGTIELLHMDETAFLGTSNLELDSTDMKTH